jgi:CDP-diacylglycerol--glycerol-3-phosphate 3-phosphatidyltransferase
MLHALTVFLLAILTDILDGIVARRQGVTVFGRFLDPITDKLFISAVFICFVIFEHVEGGLIPIWVVTILIGLDSLQLIILSVFKIKHKRILPSSAEKWGKPAGALKYIAVVLGLVALYFYDGSNMAFVVRSYGPIFFISFLSVILSVVSVMQWMRIYLREREFDK